MKFEIPISRDLNFRGLPKQKFKMKDKNETPRPHNLFSLEIVSEKLGVLQMFENFGNFQVTKLDSHISGFLISDKVCYIWTVSSLFRK